jgi:hypothetical protein
MTEVVGLSTTGGPKRRRLGSKRSLPSSGPALRRVRGDIPPLRETCNSQAGSIVASSTSMIGILSRTGYTRRHSVHFRLVPSSFCVSGFLHTGQTRISINSFSIIGKLYAPLQADLPRLTSLQLDEYISIHRFLLFHNFWFARPHHAMRLGSGCKSRAAAQL